ncbi:DUF4760 domain-containing protein [Piscibacillus salipiscarius]|uniref:DUF4760 domain-containing protein n=1 Tax=Piscibacillus salipiscarius TaxID=299480 RepID=UPI0034E22B81
MSIKNQRAAARKSTEMLYIFATVFLPSLNEYQKKIKGKIKQTDTVKFNGEFHVDIDNIEKDAIIEALTKEKNGLTDILNQLEYFSACLVHGVADEEMVFSPIATTFCDFIEREHLLISIHRSKSDSSTNYYNNMLKLYKIWSHRIQESDIKKKQDSLNQKLSDLGVKDEVKPIGF